MVQLLRVLIAEATVQNPLWQLRNLNASNEINMRGKANIVMVSMKRLHCHKNHCGLLKVFRSGNPSFLPPLPVCVYVCVVTHLRQCGWLWTALRNWKNRRCTINWSHHNSHILWNKICPYPQLLIVKIRQLQADWECRWHLYSSAQTAKILFAFFFSASLVLFEVCMHYICSDKGNSIHV